MSGEITIVETSSINIDLTSGEAQITIVADSNNISIVQEEYTTIGFVDVGLQGMPGAQGQIGPKGDIGEPLEFELLTEQQKLELRGDVGNTSTNYTNLFNNVLLS